MSGLTRYITRTGVDLSSVFMPLSFGTYTTNTGYKLSTGFDLNTLFCQKYSNITSADKTSLLLSDGQDLSDIFDKRHIVGYSGTFQSVGVNNTAIRTIYPLDSENVYLGGDGGILRRWDGSSSTLNSILGESLNNSVRVIYARDTANLYIGGLFTNNFGKINGTTYNSVGGINLNGNVLSISALDPSNVYIAGSFTNSGNYMTRLNTYSDSFTTLQSSLNSTVRAIYALDPLNVYIGGSFTNATTGTNITRWDGTQFNKLGNGNGISSGGTIFDIYALDLSNVYIGGSFTTIDGVSAANIAKFNGTSFEQLGSGTNLSVRSIYALDQYHVYIGGSFTTAGGDSMNRITMWNGSNYTQVGSLFFDSIETLKIIKNNNSMLYVGGYTNQNTTGRMMLYRT